MKDTDYKQLVQYMYRANERALRALQQEQNVLKAEYILISAQEKCDKLIFSETEE